MLSGRSTVVCARYDDHTAQIIAQCCRRMAMQKSGKALIHGNEVLPDIARVGTWPGLRLQGKVSEYQLVV
eukprot:6316388-Amphidinium_carterae.1